MIHTLGKHKQKGGMLTVNKQIFKREKETKKSTYETKVN